MGQSIPERVAAGLSQLGLPSPANLIQTMLMREGYFVGWKCRYDGGSAVLHTDDSTLDVYDEQEQLVKTVDLEADREAA